MNLFFKKSTPGGLWTVTIIPNAPQGHVHVTSELAAEAKALAELLTEGATIALQLAVSLLEADGPTSDRRPTSCHPPAHYYRESRPPVGTPCFCGLFQVPAGEGR